jgi:MYXO-CTERM domain-containing protein
MSAVRVFALAAFSLLALLGAVPSASAQDLIMAGGTMSLGGVHRYDTVSLTGGARIEVIPFNGTDRVNTGNLVIIANSITIDATSSITARGAGYSTLQCGDGRGPTIESGGAGGCSVRDSGGGGAHFGRGGRGTRDAPITFPAGFEEDCGNTRNAGGTACSSVTDCRNSDGLPTVAGSGYFHSIYEVEFGASGGDKGCRDGDGFGVNPTVAGPGGGRIVLVALTSTSTGAIDIRGTVTSNGRRGCGNGNDSGGGGAGGTVFIVGDQVQVGPSALISAAGGLGGDTNSAGASAPDNLDCPAGSQPPGGTCDDCGGGGGGGIIVVQSRSSNFEYGARFDVAGALGGLCTICQGEAGGGAGELQLDGAYIGEVCDGYDNDFDGMVDETLGNVTCGLGTCAASQPLCTAGSPNTCAPGTSGPSCFAPLDAARPRVAVILDTSASMLLDLDGFPTFGDGSVEHPGVDTNGDGSANDSRLLLARTALGNVISAYPEIEFSLARYHQDVGLDRFCQSAAWFECAGIVGTYDDPRDNTGSLVCNVPIRTGVTIPVNAISTGDECINYAGSCGSPRRGADILSGFGSSERDIVRWLDGRETDFRPGITAGNHCDHDGGGDCEVRGAGPTPLAGSLEAITDYLSPIRSTDAQVACRTYSVILVTDGAESCDGDPVAAATALRVMHGVETYVVAVSVLPGEEASLNAISNAGSGGTRPTATFVRAPEDLVPALTAIIEGSIRSERCNGADDDCDLRIDEGFDALGDACNDGGTGVCRGSGSVICAPSELSTTCSITMPGMSAIDEACNGADDDCDEAIDEGLTCTGMCTPTGPEVCNGLDDDCNGLVDEFDPAVGTPCGEDEGECAAGALRCVLGELLCVGAVEPRDEVCNGLDDDCDGMIDFMAECPAASACIEGACRRVCDPEQEFPCPPDFVCEPVPELSMSYCLPTICATCAANEICVDDTCIDPCAGITCDAGLSCVRGECVDCNVSGCGPGEVCRADVCVADRCATRTCAGTEMCVDGMCSRACGEGDCPSGQRCASDGTCESDPCTGMDCGTGRFCEAGTCRADPCVGMTCPRGDVCVSSMGCIDDPCAGVTCGAGRRCEASDRGTAACTLTGGIDGGRPDASREYVLGAGGSCSAAPGDGTRPWTVGLLLLALGLVIVRRSR